MRDETISVSTLKSPLPLVNQTRPAYFLQVILQLKEWSVTEEIHYQCKRPTYRQGPNFNVPVSLTSDPRACLPTGGRSRSSPASRRIILFVYHYKELDDLDRSVNIGVESTSLRTKLITIWRTSLDSHSYHHVTCLTML